MPVLPTGTVTFLFTDVEGSTHLLRQLGDRYADVISQHHRLLRTAFEACSGSEIGTAGDALFVAFSSAKDAVVAAVAAQRALLAHSWPENITVRVRMALHTGEPMLTETGYAGLDLNRTARICRVGFGGQILLSQITRGLVVNELPDGMTLRDLGTHRLKDLAGAEHLFQLVTADLPADFPPLQSLSGRTNLPVQLTSFIGREKQIAELKQVLSTSSLVTLTGSGGAGKTRLALQLAADLLDQFPDGVWLAELAALSTPALVPKTVATAVNVPEQPGGSLLATLVEGLRSKSLLLVLDNCEHLLDPCAELAAAVLAASPKVRIMATSREPLGVPGEIVWRVPSLSIPDLADAPSTDRLVESEGVRLFLDRAALSRRRFRSTGATLFVVAQIARRLDGIPLAIELAAARAEALPIHVIAERLDDRFRLLMGGGHARLGRQQTLQAALDWSHDLLSEQERILFRRVSVFAGEFTLEAAEEICQGEALGREEIFDLVAHLVNKSLVNFEQTNGDGRYRLLETIRQYGHSKLREAGEADGVHRRHRDWYLALAGQAEPALHGPEQGAWLERLESEHDNFRAALQWSIDAGEGEPSLRLACALWWFWSVRGHYREGLERLQTTLRSGGAPALLRARALRGVGVVATYLTDFVTARAAFEESLTIARALDDTSGIADSLYGLGRMVFRLEDLDNAAAYYGEAVNLFQTVGDRIGLARVLNSLGNIAAQRRDFATARARYTECLSICQTTGDKWLIGYAKGNLGVAARHEGAYDAARSLHVDALRIWHELKATLGIIAGLEDFGMLAAAQSKARRAAHLLGAAEAHVERLGLRLPVDSANWDIDAYIEGLGAALGEEAAAALLAEGRKMPLEQAVAYALSDEDT